jgi:hypothetical protein
MAAIAASRTRLRLGTAPCSMLPSCDSEQPIIAASSMRDRPAASRASRRRRPLGSVVVRLMAEDETVRPGALGVTKKRGRPRRVDADPPDANLEWADIEGLDDASRREQTIMLDELWRSCGKKRRPFPPLQIPRGLREEAMALLPPLPEVSEPSPAPGYVTVPIGPPRPDPQVHGNPLEFAQAVLKVLPQRTFQREPGRWEDQSHTLYRQGRVREAEMQAFHERLDKAARCIQRRLQEWRTEEAPERIADWERGLEPNASPTPTSSSGSH